MKTHDPSYEDPIVIIENEARVVAVHYGAIWGDEARLALMRRIAARLGGTQIYFPRQRGEDRRLRDEEIRARFNGRNIRALAVAFKLSERTVRRIVEASTQT